MKKSFVRLISILFLIVLFTNCKSTQTESNSTESQIDKNNEIIVLYCNEANEVYYLEDEKEIKQVLSLLPKIPNVAYSTKYILTSFFFNEHPYADYTLYVKKNGKVSKKFYIDIDNHVWFTEKKLRFFPKENIEKIISQMHKGVKHTKTIKNAKERRQFIENLREDDYVLYINLHSWADFDLQMGSFYIYVPGSKEQKIDSEEIYKNLQKHYGKGPFREIHNYSISRPKRYIEETREYEFEMRWTKEMYDKIDIYRKSEFEDDNYEAQQTFEYYTKN